jgi:hypothetical protein
MMRQIYHKNFNYWWDRFIKKFINRQDRFIINISIIDETDLSKNLLIDKTDLS